jgi:dTDP-D-glucose 4,6-dehydratase
MRTVLVTGGAGFIGGCFVRQTIAERRAPVVNLNNLTYAGNLDSLAVVAADPLHVFVRGDIRDTTLVRGLMPTYPLHMGFINHAELLDLAAQMKNGYGDYLRELAAAHPAATLPGRGFAEAEASRRKSV